MIENAKLIIIQISIGQSKKKTLISEKLKLKKNYKFLNLHSGVLSILIIFNQYVNG